MSDRQASNPYLDRMLDTFRSTVKTWERDSVIVVLLFLTIGMFTVLPLIRWYEKEETIRSDTEANTAKRNQIAEIIANIGDISKQSESVEKDIGRYGNTLADELSKKLSRFGGAVRDLNRNERRLPDRSERFPGSSIAEQFERPAVSPIEEDPMTVLMKDFNLSEKQIVLITASDRGSPEWTQGARIVKNVFDTEIDRTYQQLNQRAATEHAQLMERIRKVLDTTRPAALRLGLQLPTPDQVVRPLEWVRRPSDDAVFRSRAGKFRALDNETLKIAVDLDAALAPLNSAHTQIVARAEKLDQSLLALQTEQAKAQKAIKSLEEQFTKAETQLTQISQPLKWLPLEVNAFVRLYPAFFAVLFFILARRFARLHALRNRLHQELKNRDMSEKDIGFALMVPESALGLFAQDEPGSWMTRGVHLAVPMVLAAFLVGATWRIETSHLYTTTLPRLCNIAAVALCIINGADMLRRIKSC